MYLYRYSNLQYLSTLVTNGYENEYFSVEIKNECDITSSVLSYYNINDKYKVHVISVPAYTV